MLAPSALLKEALTPGSSPFSPGKSPQPTPPLQRDWRFALRLVNLLTRINLEGRALEDVPAGVAFQSRRPRLNWKSSLEMIWSAPTGANANVDNRPQSTDRRRPESEPLLSRKHQRQLILNSSRANLPSRPRCGVTGGSPHGLSHLPLGST